MSTQVKTVLLGVLVLAVLGVIVWDRSTVGPVKKGPDLVRTREGDPGNPASRPTGGGVVAPEPYRSVPVAGGPTESGPGATAGATTVEMVGDGGSASAAGPAPLGAVPTDSAAAPAANEGPVVFGVPVPKAPVAPEAAIAEAAPASVPATAPPVSAAPEPGPASPDEPLQSELMPVPAPVAATAAPDPEPAAVPAVAPAAAPVAPEPVVIAAAPPAEDPQPIAPPQSVTPPAAQPAAQPAAPVAGKEGVLGGVNHTVQPGESLWKLAQAYFQDGTRCQAIFEANRDVLTDENMNLVVGMVLRIPELKIEHAKPEAPKTPAAAPLVPGGQKTWTVHQGDTLVEISKKVYGVSKHWRAIAEANKATLPDPDRPQVGQVLLLPEIKETPKPAGAVGAPAPGEPVGKNVYTIKEGDSLEILAERFYKDRQKWMKIYEANKARMKDPHTLNLGQKLVIPDVESVEEAPPGSGGAQKPPAPAAPTPTPHPPAPAAAVPVQETGRGID